MIDVLTKYVADAAHKTGFDKAIDLILQESAECNYIVKKDEDDAEIEEFGGSRIGGIPDLPADIQWPDGIGADGEPVKADFLAQLRLTGLTPIPNLPLPQEGHLWVFLKQLVGQIDLAIIYDPRPDTTLAPRKPDDDFEWVYGELFDTCAVSIVRGLSAPFGKTAFRESLERLAPNAAWPDLSRALYPQGCVGQIGGFAFTHEGHDRCRNIALSMLGHPEYISPYQYDTVVEMEDSAAQVPANISTAEQRAVWKASYEKLRPQVEWTERNLVELQSWLLLLKLNTFMDVGLDLDPLWAYIKKTDLESLQFAGIIADCSG